MNPTQKDLLKFLFPSAPPRLVLPIILLFLYSIPSAAFNLAGPGGIRDGASDIVWHHRASGQNRVWHLHENLVGPWSTNALPSNPGTNWFLAATADFNRNGFTDLLWRNPSTSQNAVWFMRDTIPVGEPSPLENSSPGNIASNDPGFSIVATGDFNGNGYPDILWRNIRSEELNVWFMGPRDGTNLVGTARIEPTPKPNWRAMAAGDLNGDGHPDILLQNFSSGELGAWLMRHTAIEQEIKLNPITQDLDWRIAGTGSFTPNGQTDILWRHPNGNNAVWFMNGATFLRSKMLPPINDPGWIIAGAGGYTNIMALSASAATASPPRLELTWKFGEPNIPGIRRRPAGATSWTPLATNYYPRRFSDTNVIPGVRYEYQVGQNHIITGIQAAPIENRGKVILILENSAALALPRELEQFRQDLTGDGWRIVSTNVARHNDQNYSANIPAITSIKSFIVDTWKADPETKAVILIGRVPVPYSGWVNPDGHCSRTFPADGFYGDVDGIFTDIGIFQPGTDLRSECQAPDPRHHNFTGDGKFDQNRFPTNSLGIAAVELGVGRIDFANMAALPRRSEISLLRNYFSKNHNFRHKKIILPERIVAGSFNSNCTDIKRKNVHAQALKHASRFFGTRPDGLIEGDPFAQVNPSLWGFFGSNGGPASIITTNCVWTSSMDLIRPGTEPHTFFMSLYGSWFVDWDHPNNLMRGFLATPTYGLGVMWFQAFHVENIELAFEPLALGETFDRGIVRTLNQNNHSVNIYFSYLGDPTLRLHILAPPANFSAQPENNQILLAWDHAPELDPNYFIYRATEQSGPWTRITPHPISESRFHDANPPSPAPLYQIRTLQLKHTGSGSYTNLSQGVFSRPPP
jgi:hypothetical protein